MNYFRTSLIVLALFTAEILYAQPDLRSIEERNIAILDLTARNKEVSFSDVYSVVHICKTAGIPYNITTKIEDATKSSIIIASSNLEVSTLNSSEISLIKNYILTGGIIIGPFVYNNNLFDVFGISNCKPTNRHHRLKWTDTSEIFMRWINDPLERTISLGSFKYTNVIWSCSYNLTTAKPLAYFEDTTVGFTMNNYGKGLAFCTGLSFSGMIFRSQINRDLEAERTYISGFEPSADVIMLFIKGIYSEYVNYATYKHTVPYNFSNVFIFTHDIDCEAAMDNMLDIANYDQSHHIGATFFITTHYFRDYTDGNYYTNNISKIIKVKQSGFEIGSHSVGHFHDFNNATTFPMRFPGNTQYNYTPKYNGTIKKTNGGSIFGECEVSKNLLKSDCGADVISWRSGYLLYPDSLNMVLESLGYKYNCSNAANDVLTHFPFFGWRTRSFSSQLTNILEIPLTFDADPFTAVNYESVGDHILTIIKKIFDNYSPVILLFHPIEGYKLNLIKYLVSKLSPDIDYSDIKSFGDYWRARDDFKFNSKLENDNVLVITLGHNCSPPAESLSLIVTNGQKLHKIYLLDEYNHPVSFMTSNFEKNDLLIYFKNKPVISEVR